MNYPVSLPEEHDRSKAYHVDSLKKYYERTDSPTNVMVACCTVPEGEDLALIDHGPTDLLQDCKEEFSWGGPAVSSQLTRKQTGPLQTLLQEYPTVLTNQPGTKDLMFHDIEITDSKPIASHPYRVTGKNAELVEAEIQKMLELGVKEPSIISFASPIVLVPKKGGEIRFCMDYHELNSIMCLMLSPCHKLMILRQWGKHSS